MNGESPWKSNRFSTFQKQNSFVFIFAALLLLLIVAPLLETSKLSRELLAVFESLILFSSIYNVLKESKWLSLVMLLLGVLNLMMIWWEYVRWSVPLALARCLGLTIFLFLLIFIMYRQLSRETSVSRNVVFGSVTIYILLAYAWGLLFASLFLVNPKTFHDLDVPINSHFSPVQFLYLSFFTITTMGYSAAAPASASAKSLAIIEAIVGQLYLILVVSLLVGLRASMAMARHEKTESR